MCLSFKTVFSGSTLWLLSVFIKFGYGSSEVHTEKPWKGPLPDNNIKVHEGYRLMNWCIIGRNEPTLSRWPLVQFKPFLAPVRTYIQKEDLQKGQNYSLEFKQIKCDKLEEGLGDTSKILHQRTHIIFKSDRYFQGVLVQAVHAPFGIGFPFGQFQTEAELPCKCEAGFLQMTRTAACISRPDLEILPPTVGLFHYHELNKSSEQLNDYPQPFGVQNEMHFNFKWSSHEYSSVNIVEFWVLVVYNFDVRQLKYETFRFGPYDFSFDKKNRATNMVRPPENDPKTIYQPLDIPTPEFPSCFPTVVPSCNKITSPTRCKDVEPTLTQKEPLIDCGDTGPSYEPPIIKRLNYTRIRMEGLFDTECLLKYPAPEKRAGTQCEAWTGRFRAVAKDEESFENLNQPIRHPPQGDPDPNRLFRQSFCEPCKSGGGGGGGGGGGAGSGGGKGGKGKDKGGKPRKVKGEWSCQIGKRSCHGAVMIFVYFFIIPLTLIIGRFYKETFHNLQWCGWRLWVILHVAFGILALIVSYAGFLIPLFWKIHKHEALGYWTLAFGCLSGLGWGRHERIWLLYVFFVVHTIAGYVTWILGIITMNIGTKISDKARIVGFVNAGLTVLFMIVMTAEVCIMDKKVGLLPKRLHIPILQVRFDDMYPPGHYVRLGLLALFVLMLIVTFVLMLVL